MVSLQVSKRRNKQKIEIIIKAPDRLRSNSITSQQEIDPRFSLVDETKNKIKLVERDQSTLKPLDLTEESFITSQGTLIPKIPPRFGTASYETQDVLSIQEVKSQSNIQNIFLDHSSALLDQEGEALRAILESNELSRKELQFKTKLNEASLRTRSLRSRTKRVLSNPE